MATPLSGKVTTPDEGAPALQVVSDVENVSVDPVGR
jgi:hypothetical protein